MPRVAVLGSTGSVGTQALEVIRGHRDRYEVVALAAGRNRDLLAAQAAEFDVPPDRARSCADDPDALAALAGLADVDVVLNAVVGFAGLPATIGALEAGKRLALANKESLIAGGPVVSAARRRGGGEIVPVDSEHSALYQALRGGRRSEVRRLLLTASGGPFRGRTRAELAEVSVDESMVILAPMSHVGCFSASSTVTCSSSERVRPRNGPPLAVSRSRPTSSRAPARRAW